MFHLAIVPTGINFEYSVQLRTKVSDWNSIVWQTRCPEIDLQETIEKVLRVSKNLRIIPE